MDNDLHRAALAVACVFAVVLGASLFPATGFGTNPVPASTAGNGNASDGGATGGPNGAARAGNGTADETATTVTNTTDRGTLRESTTNGSANGDGGVGTELPDWKTTAAPTTTESAAFDSAASGGTGGSLLAVGVIVLSLLVGLVATAVGFGRHHRRRYPEQWDLPSAPHLRVLAYVRRIPQTSLSFVMFAGANAPSIFDGLASGIDDATTGFGAATSGIGKLGASLGRGLASVPGGFVNVVGGLGRGIGAFTLGLSSLSTGFSAGGFLRRGDDRPDDDPRRGGRASDEPEPDPEPPEPPASVHEAWERLQEDLGVSGSDGETPGEIARRAVQRGLPTDAVRALTRAFRDVRYGGRPDDGERVSIARDAYERLRTALDGESS